MSAPINVQLSEYTEFFDAELPIIELADILDEQVGVAPVRPLRPRRSRRRHWPVAAAALVGVLVLVGGAAWLSRPAGDAEPADQPTSTVPTSTVPTTTVPPSAVPAIEGNLTDAGTDLARVIPLDVPPDFYGVIAGDSFVVAGEAVWFPAGSHNESMTAVNTASRQVVRVPVDRPVVGMVATADGLWAWLADPSGDRGRFVRIDPKTLAITDTIESPVEPGDMIVADSAIWVTGWNSSNRVFRIDLATRTIEQIPILLRGSWVGQVDGGLWAWEEEGTFTRIDLNTRTTEVYDVDWSAAESRATPTDDAIWLIGLEAPVARFDVETHEITHRLDLDGNSGSPVSAAGAVWVPSQQWSGVPGSSTQTAGTVTRIDATTLEVTDVITVAPNPWPMTVVGDSLWVPHSPGRITHIDIATRTVTEVIEFGDTEGLLQLVESNGVMWVAARYAASGTITRITPNP